MRIILLEDIKGLGKRDEVQEVRAGYARNFLIPRKLAIPATDRALAAWEARTAEQEQERAGRLSALRDAVAKINGRKLLFSLKIGEKGEVFGSVAAKDVEQALAAEGFSAGRVLLEQPVKTLGKREVVVDCGEGIKAVVAIEIIPEP